MSTYYPSPYMPYVANYYAAGARKVVFGTVAILMVFLILAIFAYNLLLPKFTLSSAVCSRNFVVISLEATKGGNFINMPVKIEIGKKILHKRITGSVKSRESLEIAFKTFLAPGRYSGRVYVAERPLGNFTCEVR